MAKRVDPVLARITLVTMGWLYTREDGKCGWHKGCENPIKAIDLCVTHYQYCRRQGVLGKTAIEAKKEMKRSNLQRCHNITLDEYEQILYVNQQGMCPLCLEKAPTIEEMLDGRFWHVDHDHSCCPGGYNAPTCGECVRGILCPACNSILCEKMEEPGWLVRASSYLGMEEYDKEQMPTTGL